MRHPNTSVAHMQELMEKVRQCHHDVVAAAYKMRDLANGKKATLEDMVDAGFLSKECVDLLNEARKELEAQQKRLGQVVALTQTQRALMDDSIDPKVRGLLATGSPDVKTHPRLPARGSPQYFALLRWLGVPDDVASTQVLEPSFKQLTEYLGQKVASGDVPPPEAVGTFLEYVVVYRGKKTDG